jgi:hypothetical protein
MLTTLGDTKGDGEADGDGDATAEGDVDACNLAGWVAAGWVAAGWVAAVVAVDGWAGGCAVGRPPVPLTSA